MNNNKEIKTIIKSLCVGYHFINFLINIKSKVISNLISYIRYNIISKIIINIINNIINTINKYNNKSFKYKSKIKSNNISNIFAFSLIELSIVLIIIGLLVAGITGGQSLIESAKMRNFINEVNSWKQALYTFKVKYNRLPGDLNNDGFLGGWCGGNACPNGSGKAGESYSINSFPEPYNNKVQPSDAGAYIELYLNGIIDFKPDPENFVQPHIIVFPELSWKFHQFVEYKYSSNPNAIMFVDNIKNLSVWLVSDVAYISKSSYDRICKKIDRKLDGHIMDEEWDLTGNFRYQPHTHKYGNRVGVNLMDL